ncbi:hypothetical protein HY950_04195 [Candidatus Gottesmanbacteria bacterium]|nr:hypothetical protein [Candidatus Gottesmanbacteria bacterium]
MDPRFERVLAYIRALPSDGKVLVLPSTDFGYQVVHGTNNGAYIGRSMIGQLTGKKDFAGYQDMAPFSESFWRLSKEKDYDAVKRLLSLLNIQYIFYNSDPLVFDTTFPDRPYSPDYVRKFLPKNQREYREYVNEITTRNVFTEGPYEVYKLEADDLLPHVYIAKNLLLYDDAPVTDAYAKSRVFFDDRVKKEQRAVYIERNVCKRIFPDASCQENAIPQNVDDMKIQFQQMSPIKYKVNVFNARKPYTLVFADVYHRNWKIFISPKNVDAIPVREVYFSGEIVEGKPQHVFFDRKSLETLRMNSIPAQKHFVVNGYANAWYVDPGDIGVMTNYEFIIELTSQRYFYIGILISLMTGVYVLLVAGFGIIMRMSAPRKA